MPMSADYPVGGTVRRAPITGARFATPEAGDIGKGLQALGQGIDRAAQEEAHKRDLEDEAAAKQLALQRSTFTTRLLYGDGTPENPGYYNLNGKAALDAEPDVRRQLEENATELRGQATTGQRAQMFGQFLDNDTVQEERRMAGFRGQQVEVYNLEMTVGRANGYANRSVAQIVAGDADGSRVSLEAGWNETRDALHLKGLDGDGAYLASRRLEYTSAIHKEVIRLMVSQGRDVDAEAYYTAHSGEMTASAQADVAGPLRSQADVTQGMLTGRQAFTQFGADRAAAYKAVESDNPRRQAAARAELDRQYSQQAAIQDVAHDSALLAATNAVFADGTNPALMDLSRLSASERTALDKAYSDRQHGPPVEDGSDEYYRLRQLAISEPQAFAQALTGSNIVNLRVSRGDAEKLWNQKEAIIKGERTTAAARTIDSSFKLAMTRAEPLLSSYGIRNSGRTSGAYGAFQANVLRHLDFLESIGKLDDPHAVDEAVNYARLATTQAQRGARGQAGMVGIPEDAPLPRAGTNYLPLSEVEKSLRAANPRISAEGVQRQMEYYVATGGRAVYRYADIPPAIRTQLADRIKATTGQAPSQFEVEEAFTRYVMTRGQ
jgi:hypothetical protein